MKLVFLSALLSLNALATDTQCAEVKNIKVCLYDTYCKNMLEGKDPKQTASITFKMENSYRKIEGITTDNPVAVGLAQTALILNRELCIDFRDTSFYLGEKLK